MSLQNSPYRNAPRNPGTYNLAKYFDNLDKMMGRADSMKPKPVSGAAEPAAEIVPSPDVARIKRLEEKLKALEERRKAKLAKRAEKEARMEQRRKFSGGIDPTTGLPFRGSGVATAGVMARNAASLAIRFRKLGDNATADKLAEIASFGRTLTEYLAQAQEESFLAYAKANQDSKTTA